MDWTQSKLNKPINLKVNILFKKKKVLPPNISWFPKFLYNVFGISPKECLYFYDAYMLTDDNVSHLLVGDMFLDNNGRNWRLVGFLHEGYMFLCMRCLSPMKECDALKTITHLTFIGNSNERH